LNLGLSVKRIEQRGTLAHCRLVVAQPSQPIHFGDGAVGRDAAPIDDPNECSESSHVLPQHSSCIFGNKFAGTDGRADD
jgi:hypothetical protein